MSDWRVCIVGALAMLVGCGGGHAGSDAAAGTGSAGASSDGAAPAPDASSAGATGTAGVGTDGATRDLVTDVPAGAAGTDAAGTSGAAGTGAAGGGAAGTPQVKALAVPCGFVGPGVATDLAFSRDGSALLVGGGTFLKSFDATTGKHLAISARHQLFITSLEVSRDGQWAAAFGASAGSEGGLVLWQLSEPRRTTILPSRGDFKNGLGDSTVESAAFSHDSKLLVASTNRSVFVFRVSDTVLMKRVDLGINQAVGHVDFSPDDKQVRLDVERVLLDATTLQTVSIGSDAWPPEPKGTPAQWGRSDDGRVTVGIEDDLASYSIEPGTFGDGGGFVTPDGAKLTAATVSATGTLVAGGDEKGRVYVTKAVKLGLGDAFPSPTSLQRHTQAIMSVAISPDDKVVAASGRDGSIYIWRISDGTVLWHADGLPARDGFGSEPLLVGASEDGKRVAIVSDDGNGYALDTTADRVLGVSNAVGVGGLILSPCKTDPGVQVIACAGPETINYGKLGAPLVTIPRMGTSIASRPPIALGPDGVTIADSAYVPGVGGDFGRFDVVLLNGPAKTSRTLVMSHGSGGFAFSRDGKTLAGTAVGAVRTWDTTSGAIKGTFGDMKVEPFYVDLMAFSPDGKTIATCGRMDLRLVDVATGEVRILPSVSADTWCHALAFSPDGTLIAFAKDFSPPVSGQFSIPRTDVLRVSDGARLWTIDGAPLGLAFSASRSLLRSEAGGTISQWCLQ